MSHPDQVFWPIWPLLSNQSVIPVQWVQQFCRSAGDCFSFCLFFLHLLNYVCFLFCRCWLQISGETSELHWDALQSLSTCISAEEKFDDVPRGITWIDHEITNQTWICMNYSIRCSNMCVHLHELILNIFSLYMPFLVITHLRFNRCRHDTCVFME